MNPIIPRDSLCPVSTAAANKVCGSGQFSCVLLTAFLSRQEAKKSFPRGRDLLKPEHSGLQLNQNQEKQSSRDQKKETSTQKMTLDSHIFATGEGSQLKQSDNQPHVVPSATSMVSQMGAGRRKGGTETKPVSK